MEVERRSGNPARRDMSQSILCINIRYSQECEAKGFSKAKDLNSEYSFNLVASCQTRQFFFILTYCCKLKKKKNLHSILAVEECHQDR